MGNPEDIQDMLAFQRGDEQGFHNLFQRYSGPLVHYLVRFTGNRAVAEELMQETFLRVCRAARAYEPRTAFRTWLYKIATNVARNEMRRREYSVRKEPLDPMIPTRQTSSVRGRPPPDAWSPEGVAEARQIETVVQRTLSHMPERQRAALLLSRHHGFAYREIAQAMGIRVGAVKSLIHRATETLRRHLDPYAPNLPQEGEQDAM